MLKSVHRHYRRYLLNFRYYFKAITRKSKTPFAIISIVLFILYSALCYYGLDILISLINDEEVASVVNLNYIVILLMLFATSLYVDLVLFTKILIDRFRRSPGTLLRFKVIGFFFLAIIIPAILFIYVFNIFFDRSIAIFDNQAILRNMENKRWLLTQEVEKITDKVDNEFQVLKTNNFKQFYNSIITYVGVYQSNRQKLYHYKKNNFSLSSIPNYNLDSYLSKNEMYFSSYNIESGFIYQIRKEIVQGNKEYYFVIVSKVGSYLKNDINETIAVIRQIKQFELLLYPFKLFTILFLLYIYLQTFSIIAIIFYYSSNRYISPIAALIKSTKKIIQGDYKLSLTRFTRYMGNNEIKELLESFSKMARELISSRQRLERLSSIEAWKDVSRKLAHEIKNPLTPIMLATNQVEKQLMKSDLVAYDNLKENFRFIEDEVNRILNLLNEFNVLAKQEFIDLRLVATEKLIQKVKDLMRHYPHITLVVEDQYSSDMMLDSEKMLSVILNLIQNSIDSLGETEQVKSNNHATIKFKIFQEVLNTTKNNNGGQFKNIIFEVWDNGKGINNKHSNEIFKPYVTFKQKGTGLGLAICEEIVSLHQGKIDHYRVNKNNREINNEEEQYENQDDQNQSDEVEFEGLWTVFRVVIPIKKQ